MRTSKYLLATLRDSPKSCSVISHKLMLRAGLVRCISSGLYVWLPTGLRVLKKIENIIREEMCKIGALEILMPIVQPADLWEKSGRLIKYGKELLYFRNRNNKGFVLGPTHEELVSKVFSKDIISHNRFPLIVYQIHTKYRDEARPRSGVIRAREFLMKDGYSFHINKESLQKTYNEMHEAYINIFNRIGLKFCVVQANPGKIGGMLSHEFQAYSETGEDTIALPIEFNNNFSNLKLSSCIKFTSIPFKEIFINETIRLVEDSSISSLEELISKFNLSVNSIVKTVLLQISTRYVKSPNSFLGIVIRANSKISDKKIKMILERYGYVLLSYVNVEEIYKLTGAQPNFLGPINLSVPLIIDYNAAVLDNFIAGSDVSGKYFFNMNWNKDILLPIIKDLCEESDVNFHNGGKSMPIMQNCTEIGHIFQLGQKYSNFIYDTVKKSSKNNISIEMGCYGIGITRIVAVLIEQNYDKNGILWPTIIAPFKLVIIPINMHSSVEVKKVAESVYEKLLQMPIIGMDILIDDRQEYLGTIFTDMELIGIPHMLVISDKGLTKGEVEYRDRKSKNVRKVKLNMLVDFLNKEIFYL
ncbi:proline--tRNA ligase [Candidatus Blochmannia ocreatus (nom. nud.)]|uniref:Proline--tRNA ligase n=1 Tax=Candidatus Blochmannia ocreatus (nom. nud.) TaxID=251538 RepID=A0ABY4SX26_9ENTR|nr:proline--tRNA ligase [Candidatus Blochmannia ocreatus]URJ25351.1 proline--tRNA ligase [Candidatus Blochmannia ocreatus]